MKCWCFNKSARLTHQSESIAYPRKLIALDVRHGKQRINEVFYLLRDAAVVESGADVLAGGDEVHALFEGNAGGDLRCAFGCRCAFLV